MGAFIARQPNGLLCRFSTMVDTLTHVNLTDEEYIEMCAEKARREAREVLKSYLQPFELVKKSFVPRENTVEEFNKLLIAMGDTEQLDPKNYHEEEGEE